jgi:hypothetical protein
MPTCVQFRHVTHVQQCRSSSRLCYQRLQLVVCRGKGAYQDLVSIARLNSPIF